MSTHQDQISGGPGSPRGGRRAAALITLAIASGGLIGACGGDEEPTETGSAAEATMDGREQETVPAEQSAPAVDTDEVEIVEFLYEPEAVTVDAGTEITWTNADAAPHTATADDSSFDTGTLEKGDSASQTFDKPGTYTYYCRFHAFMNGTVEVR